MADGKPGRPRRVLCRVCDGHIDDVGPLSKRGKCANCGVGNMERNARELNAMQGEAVLRWRRAVAASVGAILPDAPTEND